MTNLVNYYKLDIPCLHRIHNKEKLKYNSPQWIQSQLGFSIDIDYLENKLISYLKKLKNDNYEVESKGKIPITFDDGYKDILIFEKSYKMRDFYKYFQPIIFIPISILKKPKYLLWFDKLYYLLSLSSEDTLQLLWKKYEIDRSNYYEHKYKKLILNLASGRLKNKLLLMKDKNQHKILDNLIEEFKINLNAKKICKKLYLDLREIKLLIKKNWILGSHGIYHHNFTNIKSVELKDELTKSLIKIVELGGKPFLAFPDGKYNDSIVNCALKVGFTHFFTLYSDDLLDNNNLFNRIIW